MRTRKAKPVVVSLGNLAASGGYYVACAGDAVLAHPLTLTGSIGIFTGKLNLRGLIDKLGVTTKSYAKGKHALLDDFDRPYSTEEKQLILSRLQYHYRRFLGAVGRGGA